MNPFAVPEQAITTFERIHDLSVTVHDLKGTYCAYLRPDRYHHMQPACMAAKSLLGWKACMAMDVEHVRATAAEMTEGRVQICHAGLVEWVIPIFGELDLILVLFAGVRRAGPDLKAGYRQPLDRRARGIFTHDVQEVQEVNAEEAALIMEHLRQVAARLTAWRFELAKELEMGTTGEWVPPRDRTLRRSIIERFVQQRHSERLTMHELAQALHLSEHRTVHAVRECCGKSFGELLTQSRISTASSLLQHSDLSVAEVATQSGFEDVGHFHRMFRRAMKTTPARFRSTARASTV